MTVRFGWLVTFTAPRKEPYAGMIWRSGAVWAGVPNTIKFPLRHGFLVWKLWRAFKRFELYNFPSGICGCTQCRDLRNRPMSQRGRS